MSAKGVIFDIKEFAVHDGAGIRTTVFMKGCPLRCEWCHNPEGQSFAPELMQKKGCKGCGRCRKTCSHPDCAPFHRCLHACPDGLLAVAGREVSADKLAARLARGREAFGLSGGGVTLSGGEPLAQPEFASELLDALGALGIDRAIETSGFSAPDVFRKIVSKCDFVYFDLKLADESEHIRRTGVSNAPIIENLNILRGSGVRYRLRTPLIPGATDTPENIAGVKALAYPDEIEFLPYNNLAGAKYAMLGRAYPLDENAECGKI